MTGRVSLPSRRSPPTGLPSASASPVKSSRSSISWNAMPRLNPYSRSALPCSGVDVPSMPPICGAAGEQVRRLAPDDVEVLVLGDVDVAVLRELVQLALDHPQRDVAEQPDHLERVLRQRQRHRLDVEEVAEQDRDVVAPLRVHRQPPAAHSAVVDDVVVDERRRVDELHDGRVQHRALALVAAEPRGHQQHGRADALAAASGCSCRCGESGRPATADGGRIRARPSRDRREWARTGAADLAAGCRLNGSKLVNHNILARGVSTRADACAREELQ